MDRAVMSRSKAAKADPTYLAVQDRVAAVTGVPVHPGDSAYFVAQRPHRHMGQPHHDQNHRPLRHWTVLIYLSDQPVCLSWDTYPPPPLQPPTPTQTTLQFSKTLGETSSKCPPPLGR